MPFPTGTGWLVTLVGGFGTRLGRATSLCGGVGGGPVVLVSYHGDAHDSEA